MTQSDSSEQQKKIPQESSPDSTPSVEDMWKQQRRKVLESHRAKAEIIFASLKQNFPNENLYTLQIALAVLLVPLVEQENTRNVLTNHLVRLLDIEVELGLLSKQKEQEASRTVSKAP